MFNWCQSVNIYNIQNHYHFYSEQQQIVPDTASLALDKLKTGSISVLSSTNTKNSSKSCSKRGLVLAKQLSVADNSDIRKAVKHKYSTHKYNPNRESAYSDIPVISKMWEMGMCRVHKQTDTQMDRKDKNSEKQSIRSAKTDTKLSEVGLHQIQKIGLKGKPNLADPQSQHSRVTANRVQPIQMKANRSRYGDFVNQTSAINGANMDNRKTNANHCINKNIINISNFNIDSILKHNSNEVQQDSPGNNKRGQETVRNVQNLSIPLAKLDIHELTTSRHYNSKQQSQASQSCMGSQSWHPSIVSNPFSHPSISQPNRTQMNNSSASNSNRSKYNVHVAVGGSITGSVYSQSMASQQQSQGGANNNECIYLRIMEQSRGQARQASIILSNILSRSSNECYDSGHRPCVSLASYLRAGALTISGIGNGQANGNGKNKKFNLWQDNDRNTIISKQNDQQSNNEEHSIRVQQSEICESDPKNNFKSVPNKSISTNSYTMELAIQANIECLVSLKEIGFQYMSQISQQLQIYEFVEQKLYNTDSYRNILQLYQIQMSSGSYLMIKQPYTCTLLQYIRLADDKLVHKIGQDIEQLLRAVLSEFQYFLIYPTRLLHYDDFVVCDAVVKLHDLSLFRQGKQRAFQIQHILGVFSYAGLMNARTSEGHEINGKEEQKGGQQEEKQEEGRKEISYNSKYNYEYSSGEGGL